MAPVQTDKTRESMVELNKELRAIVGDQPISERELYAAQRNQTLQLPGTWEKGDAVAGSIDDLVTFGLLDDYYDAYTKKVRSLSLEELNQITKTTVHPDKMVWVVVGDRAKIEAGLRELNWGEVRLLDADGNPAKLTQGSN